MAYKNKSEMSPESWEKYKQYRRNLRLKHLEKERERDRIRKQTKRERLSAGDIAKQNATHRKHYHANPESARKQRERRYRREPDRDIRAATREFFEGSIDFDEYNRRISGSIARAEQIVAEQIGIQKTDSVRRGNRAKIRKHNRDVDSD